MKTYKSMDCGGYYTESELKDDYTKLYELHDVFPTFEEYFEFLLAMGRQRTGGIVEIKWICRQWTKTADGWTSEFDTFETEDEAYEHGENFLRMKGNGDEYRDFEVYDSER